MLEILLEIAGIQALLFGVYYLFLRTETDYKWKRIFLLATIIISGLTPFIALPAPDMVQNVGQTYISSFEGLQSVNTTPEASPVTNDWKDVINNLMLLGAGIFFLMIIGSLYQIYRYYQSSIPKPMGDFWVWIHPGIQDSFSFFKLIFSKKLEPSIIAHEAAHVQLGHSYDILLLQLNRAVCWWNPISWWMLKEMTLIHEYQADQKVLIDNNIDEYQKLLINSTLSSMGWGLASSFHSGSLLKRLHAMKQQTKKISHWKISSLGALVAIIALVFACEELDQDIQKMSEDSRQISFEELPEDLQSDLKGKKDKYTYLLTYIDNAETSSMKEKLSQMDDIDPNLIEKVDVRKNESGGEVYIVLRKDAGSYSYLEEKSKASDEVFTLVDEQPQFPGGMTAFYQYVGENLKYPEEARKMGVQGRVFVQFVVNESGNVTDVKAVKGIGAGCDEVAEKIIAASPAFEPGKQRGKPVKVRMVMPIIFSLEPNVAKNVNDAKNTVVEIREDNGEIVDAEVIELQPVDEIVEVDPSISTGEIEAERTHQAGQMLAEAAKEIVEIEPLKAPAPPPSLPAYKGGMDQLYTDLFNEIEYPAIAKSTGIEGTVHVQFVVRKDGSISDVKAIKGIGGGCDEEAVRAIGTLTKFSPSKKEGQPTDATMVLPVRFSL